MKDIKETRRTAIGFIAAATKLRIDRVNEEATLSEGGKGEHGKTSEQFLTVPEESEAEIEDTFLTRRSSPTPGGAVLDTGLVFTPKSTPTTPSKKSSQPQIFLNKQPTPPHLTTPTPMQRQRGALPTGRGFAPTSIPQYIAADQHQSTDSTGSQDSIMTQLPLPYHLPVDSYSQGYSVPPQLGGDRPWEILATSNSSAFGTVQGSSLKSLNPNSSPYVPSGMAAQSPIMDQSFQGQSYQGDNGYGRGHGALNQLYQQQCQGQIDHTAYPAPNPYRLSDSTAACGPVGGISAQFQLPYGMSPNPYAHYGAAAGMSGYSTYNNSQPVIQQGYEDSSVGSLAVSYTMANSNQSYQTTPYGPGTPNGVAPSSYGQNQGSGHTYNNPYISAQPNMYNDNQYQSKAPASNFNNGSDMNNRNNGSALNNRHKNTFKSMQSVGSSQHSNLQSSNLATAPVRTHRGQNSRPSSALKVGGPVQPPSKNENTSTRHPSPEHNSQTSEKGDESNGAPTPGPKPHVLDLEFSSEPRNTQTPHLRSRRGQSISTTSTDPPRKNTMANWLENVPPVDGNGLREHSECLRSPPKMLSFMTTGGGTIENALPPINEGDPFSGGTPQRGNFNNPFVPATVLGAPRSGNMLRNQSDGMSPQYRNLTSGGTRKPSIDEALDSRNLPFVEYCRLAKDDTWGVIKIKNIPYSVNRPEVLAFLGRNARIVSEHDHEPVHIVMERVTSKTLDCYVEFVNFNEALNAVNRFETNRSGGRGGRLGQRHVEVELSSQEQLMKDLFPKAKNVSWRGGRPEILPRDPNDKYNSGFQGFVSKEELVMLVKHVEAPQRSPFSKDCPQRPFECLISTLLKYPWYMVDYITIQDRNLLHNATKELLSLLVERVCNERENVNLTPMLLKRVWRAAMACPGFTPSMKDDIVFICNIDINMAVELGLAPHAAEWRYLWTIGPKPGVPTDVLLYYIGLIRDATTQQKQQLSLAEQAAQGNLVAENKLFGDLDKIIEYPKDLAIRSLAEVARAEWTVIEQVLRRALTLALE